MDASHLAGVLLPLGDHGLGRVPAMTDRPSEPPQIRLGAGHQMRTPQPEQLDPVLEGAQQPVGLVQNCGVLARDVSALGQCRQGLQRRARSQRHVGPTVDELQQLDTELDVAQAARAELELAGGLGGGDMLLDPSAHRLDVLDEVLTACGLPDEWAYGVEVLTAEICVAGDGPGLEQRLELPRLGPPLVVLQMAGNRPDQWPVLALGAQGRVDRPEGAFGRGRRAGPHQCRGQLGAYGERGRLIGGGLS